jgi:hypothetical protein
MADLKSLKEAYVFSPLDVLSLVRFDPTFSLVMVFQACRRNFCSSFVAIDVSAVAVCRFITGLEGTSLVEITAATSVVPLGVILCGSVIAAPQALNRFHVSSFLVDFICVVIPALVVFLNALDAVPLVLALVCAFAAMAIFKSLASKNKNNAQFRQTIALLAKEQKSFLTAWRGTMMITTCSCILAVDFASFPRRFAKAETFGSGLVSALFSITTTPLLYTVKLHALPFLLI